MRCEVCRCAGNSWNGIVGWVGSGCICICYVKKKKRVQKDPN